MMWSARYRFIESLISGQRVLELSRPGDTEASTLAKCAASIASVDALEKIDPTGEHSSHGCIIVPEFEYWADFRDVFEILHRVLEPAGSAVLIAKSDVASGGISYERLARLLEASPFSFSRIYGQLGFHGWAFAEFRVDSAAKGCATEIDGGLVPEDLPPEYYLALCGRQEILDTFASYSVVQLPQKDERGRSERLPPTMAPKDGSGSEDEKLRRALAEAQAQACSERWRVDELLGRLLMSENQP